MKITKNTHSLAAAGISALLFALPGTSPASVPVAWTVETSHIDELRFDAFHGEKLSLEATLNGYGKPLEMQGKTARLYWQTNGMDRLWWETNATVEAGSDGATNVLKAVFSPAMDPGAAIVRGFIGVAGENYRANFTIRFRDSPGAVPNQVPLPAQCLDFSKIEVANAPWADASGCAFNTNGTNIISSAFALQYDFGDLFLGWFDGGPRFYGVANDAIGYYNDGPLYEALTNRYTKAETQSYVQRQITSAGSVTETGVGDIVTNAVPSWALAETPPESMTGNALVLTNETVKTKDGTTVTASSVGAVSHNDKILWVNDNLAINAVVNTETIDCSQGVRYQSEHVVYGISTNGTDYLHENINLTPIADDARNALAFSSGVYQYMNANTNAWFEGTNYNVNADQAAGKTKYEPESWEDVATTPCSLQLYEIRDGSRQKVWDQRDWTVYYWNFKSAQLSNNLASATTDASRNVASNYMRRGWSKYTAVNGLDNPSPSTLFVDTEKVSLMAGMQWEKMFELSGHAYYTLTGNGITISTNDQNSTFLSIKDFEGNACLTFRKTSSYLVYCECGTDITNCFIDASSNVCFTLSTSVRPTAEFSTTLDDADFVEQDESGCPADCEWTGSAGSWVCHFLLKSDTTSTCCFARFKVLREGENVIEHSVPIKLDGGIVFTQDGTQYKIKPSVTSGTVTWSIVQ